MTCLGAVLMQRNNFVLDPHPNCQLITGQCKDENEDCRTILPIANHKDKLAILPAIYRSAVAGESPKVLW